MEDKKLSAYEILSSIAAADLIPFLKALGDGNYVNKNIKLEDFQNLLTSGLAKNDGSGINASAFLAALGIEFKATMNNPNYQYQAYLYIKSAGLYIIFGFDSFGTLGNNYANNIPLGNMPNKDNLQWLACVATPYGSASDVRISTYLTNPSLPGTAMSVIARGTLQQAPNGAVGAFYYVGLLRDIA